MHPCVRVHEAQGGVGDGEGCLAHDGQHIEVGDLRWRHTLSRHPADGAVDAEADAIDCQTSTIDGGLPDGPYEFAEQCMIMLRLWREGSVERNVEPVCTFCQTIR